MKNFYVTIVIVASIIAATVSAAFHEKDIAGTMLMFAFVFWLFSR